MSNSFYPAARKVFDNPIVKWVGGLVIAGLTAMLTTGVYPFAKGWAITRASTEEVRQVEVRVSSLEASQRVDFQRLNSARTDDTGALTNGEQLQWAIIQIKRNNMRLVAEIRARVGLEARLRMPNPNSDAAKRAEAAVKAKFDDLVFHQEDPTVAGQKALEHVYGVPRN